MKDETTVPPKPRAPARRGPPLFAGTPELSSPSIAGAGLLGNLVESSPVSGEPAEIPVVHDVPPPEPAPPDRMSQISTRLSEAVAVRKAEISQLESLLRVAKEGDPTRVVRQLELGLAAVSAAPAAPPAQAASVTAPGSSPTASLAPALPVKALLDELLTLAEAERAARREVLSRALKDACARDKIGFRVVARDPVVSLRLPPLAVRFDKDKAYADLLFAGERLDTVPAEAESILSGWRRATAALDGDNAWDPAAFHLLLWRAWRYVLVDEERETRPDWVELNAVHTMVEQLAAQGGQSRRGGYPRWRFAWDIHRLRRDRKLFDRGWRLVIGAATGSSTKDKRRVWWLEDGEGNGQYQLTLKFVRQERLAGADEPPAEGATEPSLDPAAPPADSHEIPDSGASE